MRKFRNQASISTSGKYRYWLTRKSELDEPTKPSVLFVMLNPSTADATKDDPTIKRCRRFAKDWGCAGIMVVNLYAYRATDPKELRHVDDPYGPGNVECLVKVLSDWNEVVCAWGGKASDEAVAKFKALARARNVKLMCLGTTQSGSPRHPLFIRASKQLEEYQC